MFTLAGRSPAGRVRREPSPLAVMALRAWPFPPFGRLTPTRRAALRAVACQHSLRARCCAEILLTQTDWKSKRRLRPRRHSYLPSNSTELCSTCTKPNRLCLITILPYLPSFAEVAQQQVQTVASHVHQAVEKPTSRTRIS